MLSLFFLPACIGCEPPPPPPPPPPVINFCTQVTQDLEARAYLFGLPVVFFEYGFSVDCVRTGNQILPSIANGTASIAPPPANTGDLCITIIRTTSLSVAAGHTHPYFRNTSEVRYGRGCFGRKNYTQAELNTLNRDNRNFSTCSSSQVCDTSSAQSRNKPLYLGTPQRNAVKVYRKDSAGVWRSFTIG